MDKHLHIITLNIPYPPDYGGMIDTFFRIRSLGSLGIKIHLHCFEYGRRHSSELETLCENVDYYPRDKGIISHLSFIPYIISGRKSDRLLENLLRNDYPILFDGLHTTFLINNKSLLHRKKFVRLHNIEHRYYQNLAESEKNLFKKMFFMAEAYKLRKYEKILLKADKLLAISPSDNEYFKSRYNRSEFVPPFHPYEEVESETGVGNGVIYHGDLSVNENIIVAEFLIREVFSKISYPCIIAGKDPPPHLARLAASNRNISFFEKPDEGKMADLIRNAHINILPALSSEGLKLKLIIALFAGRHCIANSRIIYNTGLESQCTLADSPSEITEKIHLLMQQPFTDKMKIDRGNVLMQKYNNKINAEKLVRLIFGNIN